MSNECITRQGTAGFLDSSPRLPDRPFYEKKLASLLQTGGYCIVLLWPKQGNASHHIRRWIKGKKTRYFKRCTCFELLSWTWASARIAFELESISLFHVKPETLILSATLNKGYSVRLTSLIIVFTEILETKFSPWNPNISGSFSCQFITRKQLSISGFNNGFEHNLQRRSCRNILSFEL